tara:strand:- start:446 stop:715 length:270 start_codon:yes stop_codon:yes gene_type:complete
MYTLVQHSGWAAAGKESFRNAVELSSIMHVTIEQIEEAGGLIFETYSEASDREFQENYPPEVRGLTPRVNGTFSDLKISGQKIYIASPV